ncbi:MAG: hypothetical protein KJ737_13720 [Proteobacteria bacterium]|nr:hypothetical protein [Pseudomonadota bacterium]
MKIISIPTFNNTSKPSKKHEPVPVQICRIQFTLTVSGKKSRFGGKNFLAE